VVPSQAADRMGIGAGAALAQPRRRRSMKSPRRRLQTGRTAFSFTPRHEVGEAHGVVGGALILDGRRQKLDLRAIAAREVIHA
jgi:hypothetical protein